MVDPDQRLRRALRETYRYYRENEAMLANGPYPISQRWRVDIFFALLAIGIAWMLWLRAPRRDLGAAYFFVARSKNRTSAARSSGEPMRCSGILVPGV